VPRRVEPRLPVDPIEEAVKNWSRRGWGTPSHLGVALSVGRVADIVDAAARDVLGPLGLTSVRHEVLMLLYFSVRGELALGKISDRLMVHATSVTTTVDALEAMGLVERVPHPNDRRATLARITDSGKALAVRSAKRLAADSFGVGVLEDDEAVVLFSLLRKLRVAAGDFPADEPPASPATVAAPAKRRRH
jgi:DNA-binding MarR family transcriptional regulator